MKNLKRMICLVAVVFFVAGSAAFAAGAPGGGNPQEKCPVMSGNVDKNAYADYGGKRIYFCCAGCLDDFKKDPAKYIKKLQDQGVVLEDAPKAN